MSTPVHDAELTPVGHDQITGLSAVRTLTIPSGTSPTGALIQAETQNVRWRDDGTNPTASVGIQLQAGKDFWYTGDLTAIKFIEEAVSAKINVAFYGIQ